MIAEIILAPSRISSRRLFSIPAKACERDGDQSRNGALVSAPEKIGHFDRWL
jgi:hypothetical protein